MMTATDIARRLELRRFPRSWRGRCPACDYPGTFSVRAGRDERALLFCANCQDRDALPDLVAQATRQERQCKPRDDLIALTPPRLNANNADFAVPYNVDTWVESVQAAAGSDPTRTGPQLHKWRSRRVTAVVVETFRAPIKSTLRGFVRCRLPSRLVIYEIALHVCFDDGRAWASPPDRPMVDRDGTVMRDPGMGKIKYAAGFTFASALIRNQWSDAVISAVRWKHRGAFT